MIRRILTKPARLLGNAVLSALDSYRARNSHSYWHAIEDELDVLVNDIQSQLQAETLNDVDRKWFDKMMNENGEYLQDLVEEYMSQYKKIRWQVLADHTQETVYNLKYTALLLSEKDYFNYTQAAAALVQMVYMSVSTKIKLLMYEYYIEKTILPDYPVEEEEEDDDLSVPYFSGTAGEA